MLVRASVTHLQPPTGTFRLEGEEFEHTGELYKHVDPVEVEPEAPRRGRKAKAPEAEE